MSRFRDHAAVYGPDELAIFQEAFDHACRKLGLDPSPTDDTHYKRLREDLATAIMNAARLGERDPFALRAFAMTFGMRNWHLPKR
jgi:hypothetical protein